MASIAHAGSLGYSHDNLRHVVITATCFALSISTISVGLRLLCRKITGTKVFFDDYLIIVALVCSLWCPVLLAGADGKVIIGVLVWRVACRRCPYVPFPSIRYPVRWPLG